MTALCDHIVETHHAYLREELPRLDFMTRKVAAVHGDHEPHLQAIREVFIGFSRELSQHMAEEEEVLFPAIRKVDASGQRCCDREACAALLHKLESEHAAAGDALARFRDLTNGYQPPSSACNTYRALYDGLARLEANMHQHVHKENNVLFPRITGQN